jgi:hypothetical protein
LKQQARENTTAVKSTAEKRSRSTLDFKENDIASKYIRENFEPNDRLAVVLLNKRSGAVIQRLAPAEKIAAPDCQKWLHYMNQSKYEVYISMNTLRSEASGRTKEDIGCIRHIYLDIDQGGNETLERLMARSDLPRPNYVLTTSPGKYQVVWKVEGFTQEQAEVLQRGLVREMGADPAAPDSSRVLRLPGLENHKYEQPHLVQVQNLSELVHRPEHFPRFPDVERVQHPVTTLDDTTTPRTRRTGTRITQSERDWAYAKRALSRGESKEAVIEAIASYRRFDKRRPRYYAALTVEKASQSTR